MNYLQRFMLLFCSIITIHSCTTENNKIENQENNLTLNDFKTIGQRHNDYLSLVYQDFDFSSENKLEELKSSLLSIKIPELSENEKSEAINSIFDSQNQRRNNVSDIELIKANLESDLAKNIIDDAYKYLNALEFHSELSAEFGNLKTNASNNLNGNDLNGVLSYLEVIEQSSYFWKQSEFGGSGEGYSILLNLQNQGQAARGVSPCTRAVIAADGAAAATTTLAAGIGGWIAGAFNPAAFATAVAIASAAASVIASNTHYACHDEDGDGDPDDSNNNQN